MDFLALSLIMLLAQFSPGPDMMLLLRNALRHPAKAGLWTVMGIACGLSVHLTVVLAGLAVAVKNSRFLYPLLLLAGGIWLGWLAVSLLRAASTATGSRAVSGHSLPLASRTAFLQGLLTNLSNVKAILFLGSVVLTWLGQDPPVSRRLVCFAIVIGQAVLFWSLFVLALQHPRVRSLWNRIQRPLNALFGLSLLFLALAAVGESAGLILKKQ